MNSAMFGGEAWLGLIRPLAEGLRRQNILCGTAESCTGGLIGAALTAVPGSSAWYRGGVVAYSNEIKMALLDVPENILKQYGAVSEQSARHMALGACRRLGVQAALAVTGIAGPDGGSAEKPVGTVWLGWALCEDPARCGLEHTRAKRQLFPGSRDEVRVAAAQAALAGLTALLAEGG